ncbi:hypothetical protein [Streptomyces umbrinus]|uniref:hypothetical protein n=1 Tax=Streptomyces umbrinus TaxID=67370 RepID=UPI001BCA0780|nr:hypothetical protein [Streptomyces umbrinus]
MEARTFTYLSGDALLDDGTYARASGCPPCAASMPPSRRPRCSAWLSVSSSATSRVPTPPVTGLLLLASPLGPLFGDAQHCGAGVPRRARCCSSQTTDATVRTVGSLGPRISLLRVFGYTAEPPLAAGAVRTRDG